MNDEQTNDKSYLTKLIATGGVVVREPQPIDAYTRGEVVTKAMKDLLESDGMRSTK